VNAPPLPLEEAQRRLLALAPELPIEPRDVADCAGFYLTEPLVAQRTQPAAAMSAMDGYAVAGDQPGLWRVIGESAAGRPWRGALGSGEAVRVSTGALMPEGSDRVLIQEDCRREGDTLDHAGPLPPVGRHVRRAGLDFTAGETLLAAGTRIGPAQLALAIAAGHDRLPVRRPLRWTVIDSGDELTDSGAVNAAHHLPASNGSMLAAMAEGLPATATRLGPVPDELAALCAAFESARDADVVVTSGGASVGDHDLLRPALERIGADIAFWRVAIKPGKPLLVARRGGQVIIGLPGNPASAFVTAFLFVLPLLRAGLGCAEPLPRAERVLLGAPLGPGGKRLEFLRARLVGGEVVPETEQDSGALLPLARADVLIRREIDAPAATAGDMIWAYRIQFG
jgi:molybdopterin molybdotransferase